MYMYIVKSIYIAKKMLIDLLLHMNTQFYEISIDMIEVII